MVSPFLHCGERFQSYQPKTNKNLKPKVKFSKFQSVTISLIMNITRPNVLRVIDLEKLFRWYLHFCTVVSGSKVISQKPTKIWSQSQIFKISICHHFLNNEYIKTKCSACDRSWEALPMVSSIFALWWAVPKLSDTKNRQKSEAKVKFSKFQSVTISLIMNISRPNVLQPHRSWEALSDGTLHFCTVVSGSKVIIRKPKQLKLEKFSKFQSHLFLNNEDIKPNVLRLIDLEKV